MLIWEHLCIILFFLQSVVTHFEPWDKALYKCRNFFILKNSIYWYKQSICQPYAAVAEQLKAQLFVPDGPTLPNPFQAITNSDIEGAGDENNMVPDEDSDVDIELQELLVPFPATLYVPYTVMDLQTV